jgi:hypothetical protein
MNYYQLKSILGSDKKTFSLRNSTASFQIIDDRKTPYIEPNFEKVIYETEKPAVILVSAVGATGKSTLAGVLSYDTKLPILDLGKHKPVGDNTLTGLLTTAYVLKDISGILEGLSDGSYGIIIDGIDEGRSKTTEKGFEAFLDDIANLCKSSPKTTFVMMGRTQILDECWTYLDEKGISTGLITISPFSIDSASKYIDEFTKGMSSPYAKQYEAVRTYVIEKLGAAFSTDQNDFLSFIGYPPVLDAIVTLLTEENNYHKLLEDLSIADGGNLEVALLHRIATYILDRERRQKVIPNIVEQIVADAPEAIRGPAVSDAFSLNEQSIRLVAHCLGESVALSPIPEPQLNEKYEAQLVSWLPEHPFLAGKEFRNAVFEAVALATLMASHDELSEHLVSRYMASHKHSYHLVYMADAIIHDHLISLAHLNHLLLAAMEFRSVHSTVELRIDGEDSYANNQASDTNCTVGIEINLLVGEDEVSKTFTFEASATNDTTIKLGPRLAGAFINVPCAVEFVGPAEIELIAPVEISAHTINLNAKTLVTRPAPQKGGEDNIVLSAATLESHLETILANGVSLDLSLEDVTGLAYPAIRYAQRRSKLPSDPHIVQKYLRLKRILVEFRSHSKGSLARFKDKIESERVLKNDIGRSVLQRLLEDKVLHLDGKFYRLNPEGLNKHLGMSWENFRRGEASEDMLDYLRSIT